MSDINPTREDWNNYYYAADVLVFGSELSDADYRYYDITAGRVGAA